MQLAGAVAALHALAALLRVGRAALASQDQGSLMHAWSCSAVCRLLRTGTRSSNCCLVCRPLEAALAIKQASWRPQWCIGVLMGADQAAEAKRAGTNFEPPDGWHLLCAPSAAGPFSSSASCKVMKSLQPRCSPSTAASRPLRRPRAHRRFALQCTGAWRCASIQQRSAMRGRRLRARSRPHSPALHQACQPRTGS